MSEDIRTPQEGSEPIAYSTLPRRPLLAICWLEMGERSPERSVFFSTSVCAGGRGQSLGTQAASIFLGQRLSGWPECSFFRTDSWSYLYPGTSCLSGWINSGCGYFECDRRISLQN